MNEPRLKQLDNPLRMYLDTVKQWFSQGYRDQIIIAINQETGRMQFNVPTTIGYGEAAEALQCAIDDLLSEDEEAEDGPSGNA